MIQRLKEELAVIVARTNSWVETLDTDVPVFLLTIVLVALGVLTILATWLGARRSRGAWTKRQLLQIVSVRSFDPHRVVGALGPAKTANYLPVTRDEAIRAAMSDRQDGLLTDFAEYPQMYEYTKDWFLKAVCDAAPIGPIDPARMWTEEYLDWHEKKDLERPRKQQPSEGWTWLKSGAAEGVLLGGCLESLQHLRGTRFWSRWDGAILFFETSEEKPSLAKVDAILMDYGNMGVFAKLQGMLVGRPMGYSNQERKQLHDVLLERTTGYAFPVVADMDFGHTAPQFTVPVGCRARIDATRQCVEILDAAVV